MLGAPSGRRSSRKLSTLGTLCGCAALRAAIADLGPAAAQKVCGCCGGEARAWPSWIWLASPAVAPSPPALLSPGESSLELSLNHLGYALEWRRFFVRIFPELRDSRLGLRYINRRFPAPERDSQTLITFSKAEIPRTLRSP